MTKVIARLVYLLLIAHRRRFVTLMGVTAQGWKRFTRPNLWVGICKVDSQSQAGDGFSAISNGKSDSNTSQSAQRMRRFGRPQTVTCRHSGQVYLLRRPPLTSRTANSKPASVC